MTSKERILVALSHREPDRVPFDIGGIPPTSISIGAYQNLLTFMQWPEEAETGDIAMQQAKLSEAFLQRFQVDTRRLRYRTQRSWNLDIQQQEGYALFFDEWGAGWKMPQIGGKNYFIFHHPLSQVETDDLPRYPWPDPLDPYRLEGLEEEAPILKGKSDPALVLWGPLSQGMFQFAAQLEGTERFFMNLVLDPFRVEWVMDKLLEMRLRFFLWALERLSDWVDVVGVGDDFGHQKSQWLSLEMFRKFIKPRYSELFLTLKRRFRVKILFHSCGAIYPFIPDMIEMGVDILNPIQLGAVGMGDTRKLKREFGDVLTFWGGGVDVQTTLPFSTPQLIKDEVKRRINDLAPGGGFIFTPTQSIQPDIPPENFMTMWRALQDYGIYPIENLSRAHPMTDADV